MSHLLDSAILEALDTIDNFDIADNTISDVLDAEDGYCESSLMDEIENPYEGDIDEDYLDTNFDEDEDGDIDTGILDDPNLLEDDEIIDMVLGDNENEEMEEDW